MLPLSPIFFDIWECTFRKKWIMPTYMVYLEHIHMLSPSSNLPTSCFTFYLWCFHCALPWPLFFSAPSHSKLDSFFWKLHHFGVSKMVWLRRLCLSRVFFPPKCLTDFCKMFTNMETGRWSWHMEPVANGYTDVWYQKSSWNKLLVRPYKGLATTESAMAPLALPRLAPTPRWFGFQGKISGCCLGGVFLGGSNPQCSEAAILFSNSWPWIFDILQNFQKQIDARVLG